MGGKIALASAARQPAGLLSLVLVAPSPPTPERISEAERSYLFVTHGDRAAAEETAGKIAIRVLPAAVRAMVIEDNLRSSRPAWLAWLERGSHEDISVQMTKVVVPSLVVVDENDPVLPVKLLKREVVRRITGARLTRVPNVGHLLPLEAPRAIARILAESLPTHITAPAPPTCA